MNWDLNRIVEFKKLEIKQNMRLSRIHEWKIANWKNPDSVYSVSVVQWIQMEFADKKKTLYLTVWIWMIEEVLDFCDKSKEHEVIL